MEKKINELKERLEMAESIKEVYITIENEMKTNTMHYEFDDQGNYVYADLSPDDWRYEEATRQKKVYIKVLEYLEKMI